MINDEYVRYRGIGRMWSHGTIRCSTFDTGAKIRADHNAGFSALAKCCSRYGLHPHGGREHLPIAMIETCLGQFPSTITRT
jgi:hypothetical protein